MNNLNDNPTKPKTERSKSLSTSKSSTKINADRERELQQLKNLGVVSVLNKTFNSQDNGMVLQPQIPTLPPTTLSPSSSTSTNNTEINNDHPNKVLMKSPSVSHLNFISKQSFNLGTDIKKNKMKHYKNDEEQWIISILPPEYNEPSDVPGNLNEKGNSLVSEMNSINSPYTSDNHNDNKVNNMNNMNNDSNNDYQQIKSLLNQAEDKLKSYQNLESSTKNQIESWTQQRAIDSLKVHQLSEIITKQDQMIIQLENHLSSTLEDNLLLKSTIAMQDNNNDDDIEKVKKDLELRKEVLALRKELSQVQLQKSEYEQTIISLWSELESSQDQTRKLILLADELKKDNDDQKLQIEEKIEKMTKSLLEKDILIQRYKNSNSNNNSRNSYIELMNDFHHYQNIQRRLSKRSSTQPNYYYNRDSQYLDDNATIHSSTSFGSSTYSERSMPNSRYSYSSMNRPMLIHSNSLNGRYSRETLPKRKEKSKGTILSWPPMDPIPPPNGPPPSVPLPPLPVLESSPSNKVELQEDILELEQVDPSLTATLKMNNDNDNNDDLKHQRSSTNKDEFEDELEEIKSSDSSTMSSNHHLSINDENLRQGLSSSLELLLLLQQSPSKFALDDEETMKEAYREFNEQLQSRLSISKEIDQLQVWDHEALERIQKRQSNLTSSLPSNTTSTGSSSKKSSLLLENDHHHGKENTAFWKGMKKKLRV
ncbi:unnamed protein product [Cunninghamella blakesleeana]